MTPRCMAQLPLSVTDGLLVYTDGADDIRSVI